MLPRFCKTKYNKFSANAIHACAFVRIVPIIIITAKKTIYMGTPVTWAHIVYRFDLLENFAMAISMIDAIVKFKISA